MRIMGIDPGIAHTGYAVIESLDRKLLLHDIGIIETSPRQIFPDRLKKIGTSLEKIIEEYQPDEVSIEDIFIASNPKLALKLGQARGVVIYIACKTHIQIFEYTPLQVKKAVTGNGKAGKDQVAFMVKRLFGIKKEIKPLDITDAMAITLTHLQRVKMRK